MLAQVRLFSGVLMSNCPMLVLWSILGEVGWPHFQHYAPQGHFDKAFWPRFCNYKLKCPSSVDGELQIVLFCSAACCIWVGCSYKSRIALHFISSLRLTCGRRKAWPNRPDAFLETMKPPSTVGITTHQELTGALMPFLFSSCCKNPRTKTTSTPQATESRPPNLPAFL